MHRTLATITNSPNGFGGVSTWLERITQTLPQCDWWVTTITHALDCQHLANWSGNHPGMQLKPLFGKFALFHQIEPLLEQYLDKENPDVVIVNGSYWMMPVLQRRKQRGGALRVIGFCHADEEGYYLPLLYYQHCFDQIVAVSRTCYQKLIARGCSPSRTTLLAYGVPCPKEPLERHRSGPIRLAYVGRLIQYQKRIFDFVNLVQVLDQRNIDYNLDFYGDGEDGPSLRARLASWEEAGRVAFHKWIPAAEVAERVWPTADVFILPSGFEGLSISMLEAMANGVVPVVSKVDSGAEEAIEEGKTGFTFPVGHLDQCADRVAILANEPERLAAMSLEAWQIVQNRFSLEAYARALALLLNTVVDSPPQLASARYMGFASHSLARWVPGTIWVHARRWLRRGGGMNQGYAPFQ